MSIDYQKDLTNPSKFSWLKKGHCMGSEEVASYLTGVLNLDQSATSWNWQQELQDLKTESRESTVN